jgi:hypothetical protein
MPAEKFLHAGAAIAQDKIVGGKNGRTKTRSGQRLRPSKLRGVILTLIQAALRLRRSGLFFYLHEKISIAENIRTKVFARIRR